MTKEKYQYQLLENPSDIAAFKEANDDIKWLCLDTEFIGEKRYNTLLCLIQVATENGIYVFDSLKCDAIQPLLDLIERADVVKITHAGENDYRLLHNLYGTRPKNIFDTQIAAGFIGYKYPVSFRYLLEEELKVRLSKSQTVTDWEQRPVKPKQMNYAIEDVIYLYELRDKMLNKLRKLGRDTWALEECSKMEKESFYYRDPNKEALTHNLMPNLPLKGRVFLLRLFEWRRGLAEQRNHSKEMVLPKKAIAPIVKTMGSGVNGLRNNRRISDRFVDRYGKKMEAMYNQDISEEERGLVEGVQYERSLPPKQDLKLEMLYSFINYRCLEQRVAPSLAFSRTIFKQMKADFDHADESLENGWRRTVLGDDLIHCLKHRKHLAVDMAEGKMSLKVTE